MVAIIDWQPFVMDSPDVVHLLLVFQAELAEVLKAQRKSSTGSSPGRKRKDSGHMTSGGSDVDVEDVTSPPKAKRKKQKVISTGTARSQAPAEKLYCICKTPYDNSK